MLSIYQNGNYRVYLNDDGTKTRICDEDVLKPDRPESIDVQITTKCSRGCNFCYAGCGPDGKHAELFDVDNHMAEWIESIPKGTEVSINGNDLDHPELYMFLKICRAKGVIVNVTLHRSQFVKNYIKIRGYQSSHLIYGVGISLDGYVDDTLLELIKMTPNAVCHVIAGILDSYFISDLMNQDLRLLVLGYKKKGRGAGFYEKCKSVIDSNIEWLGNVIMDIAPSFKSVMFDCLAVEQLGMRDKISKEDWEKYYMGPDGTTTFYIDAVNGKFAKSSTETEYFDIGNLSVNEMFRKIIDLK